MSELLIPEDDPDPLPRAEYVGPRARDTFLAERELDILERQHIGELITSANTILTRECPEGDSSDLMFSHDHAMIRRVHHQDRYLYFFKVYEEDGEVYCRSWTNMSSHVNWCLKEELFEPAADVMRRLEAEFAVDTYSDPSRRNIASWVLAKLLRRNPDTSL